METTTSENTDIFKFLDGSQDYQGVWYGDKHPTLKGNFWWRTILREQLAEKDKEISELQDALRKALNEAKEHYTMSNETIEEIEKLLK